MTRLVYTCVHVLCVHTHASSYPSTTAVTACVIVLVSVVAMKSASADDMTIQNPATEKKDFFKIQQEREREDLLKIQQEREKAKRARESGRRKAIQTVRVYVYVRAWISTRVCHLYTHSTSSSIRV